jgi:hypothetical protein
LQAHIVFLAKEKKMSIIERIRELGQKTYQGVWGKAAFLSVAFVLSMGIACGLALGADPNPSREAIPNTFDGSLPTFNASTNSAEVAAVSDDIGSGILSTLVPWNGAPIPSGNKVKIAADHTSMVYSSITQNIVGGLSRNASAASSNQVWLTDGFTVGEGTLGGLYPSNAKGAIIGGFATQAAAANNAVIIRDAGGTAYGIAIGGASGGAGAAGTVSGNTAAVYAGDANYVLGGSNDYKGCSGGACGGTAQNNQDWIKGAGTIVRSSVGGGASAQGSALQNKVLIEGGIFGAGASVFGGLVRGSETATLTGLKANGNKVQLYGGTSGNSVKVSGGGAIGEVIGGQIYERAGSGS